MVFLSLLLILQSINMTTALKYGKIFQLSSFMIVYKKDDVSHFQMVVIMNFILLIALIIGIVINQFDLHLLF